MSTESNNNKVTDTKSKLDNKSTNQDKQVEDDEFKQLRTRMELLAKERGWVFTKQGTFEIDETIKPVELKDLKIKIKPKKKISKSTTTARTSTSTTSTTSSSNNENIDNINIEKKPLGKKRLSIHLKKLRKSVSGSNILNILENVPLYSNNNNEELEESTNPPDVKEKENQNSNQENTVEKNDKEDQIDNIVKNINRLSIAPVKQNKSIKEEVEEKVEKEKDKVKEKKEEEVKSVEKEEVHIDLKVNEKKKEIPKEKESKLPVNSASNYNPYTDLPPQPNTSKYLKNDIEKNNNNEDDEESNDKQNPNNDKVANCPPLNNFINISVQTHHNFVKFKRDYTLTYFKRLNNTIFKDRFQESMLNIIDGNNPNANQNNSPAVVSIQDNNGERSAIITIYLNEIKTIQKLINVLSHQLCHAATWIFDNSTISHGAQFKYWVRISLSKYPDLSIDLCDNYNPQSKYYFRCENRNCDISFGRPTILTETIYCGQCNSPIVQINSNSSNNATPAALPKINTSGGVGGINMNNVDQEFLVYYSENIDEVDKKYGDKLSAEQKLSIIKLKYNQLKKVTKVKILK